MDHTWAIGASGEIRTKQDASASANGITFAFGTWTQPSKMSAVRHQAGSREAGPRMYQLVLAWISKLLRMPGSWRMGIGGFGECLPNHNNYVRSKEKSTLGASPR